ncbi:hypothetical protein DVH24_027605 [Malus domestica]|uniref:Uncharacterized protein n=1 Tax=Malus domestica TaxID=3750 RepID=A0A498H7T5_MALDO|nr:hypothetical protein DVH24_027605 [Malus domestica]
MENRLEEFYVLFPITLLRELLVELELYGGSLFECCGGHKVIRPINFREIRAESFNVVHKAFIVSLADHKASFPHFTSLYVEKAFMNSSHKVMKFMMDLDERPTYHFIAFYSSVEGNILHIRGSMWWLYRAMAFLCYMIWLDGSESPLKYFTLGYVNLSSESSHIGYRRKGIPHNAIAFHHSRTLSWDLQDRN